MRLRLALALPVGGITEGLAKAEFKSSMAACDMSMTSCRAGPMTLR